MPSRSIVRVPRSDFTPRYSYIVPLSEIMSGLYKLLAGILKGSIKRSSRKNIVDYNGIHKFGSMQNEVTVTTDSAGIPTISGQNFRDVVIMQGFVHAAERLFSMELNRRTARGRLSETFGDVALETDKMALTFGFEELARKDWDTTMRDDDKALIEAYVEGVNHFIGMGKHPVEFGLVKLKPEPWTWVDVVAFGRLMVWQLSHAWHGVLSRWRLIQEVGEEKAAELEFDYDEFKPSILKIANEMNTIDVDGILRKVNGIFLKQTGGSNSITVAGHLTESGKPINSNDVHLPISTPSLWHQMKLEVKGEFSVKGISLPSIPLILIGATEGYSWGVTLAYVDGADLFIEKVNLDDKTYEFNGEKRPLKVREEQIPIKGGKVHTFEVFSTHHGPIISDTTPGVNVVLSSCDVSLQPSKYLEGWVRLNTGRTWNEFVVAMECIDSTQLNFSYADVEGNIGYWCTGKIPIRNHDSLLPVQGWTDEYEWKGFVPFEEAPHALNPSRGYIVTCNHKIVPDDYPHYLGKIFMNGYRAQRIESRLNTLIDKGEKITKEHINSMMLDEFCIPGKEFVTDVISNFEPETQDERMAKEILENWDFIMNVDSKGAAVYETVRYFMVLNLFKSALPDEIMHHLLGVGPNPVLLYANEFYGHDTTTLFRMLKTGSTWLEDYGGKDKLISDAISDAFKFLKKNCGKPSSWRYGDIHKIYFPHAFDINPLMKHVFNPKPVEIGGNTDTPKQTGMFSNDPFDNKAWSLSYRYVIDYGEPDRYYGIIAPGQSGHVASEFYIHLIEPWLAGEYLLFP